MNDEQQLIERIQSSGWKSVWIITGGGIGALHRMLTHPGASRFILDAHIPYSAEALESYLGSAPEQACSAETAEALAAKACGPGILVVACTAALATSRQRKGEDRAFICLMSQEKTVNERIDLSPGSRTQQDQELSERLVSMLAAFVGVL